jgi:hypothetical protein
MNQDLADFINEQRGQLADHGRFPSFRQTRVAIGYDPASTRGPDDSAVVVVEGVKEPIDPSEPDWFDPKTNTQRLGPQILNVRKAFVMPRGTSYPGQWDIVRQIYDSCNRQGKAPEVWVDSTGLGGPLPSMARAVGLHPQPIVITGGGVATQAANGDWHIPKSVLCGLAVAALHNLELKFPSLNDPVIKALVGQMKTFVSNMNASGSAMYGAQGSAKDDLACAMFYAIFAISERRAGGHWSHQPLII